MALINWQWQNPDVINDQRNAVAANKEAMDYNQTAALNSVVDKYMDSTGNMTGDYYTAATRAGLGPDAIAKISAIRADRARKQAEMSEAKYKSWLYGGNPYAGDTSAAQSQSNWGNKPLNAALGFNSQETPATGPSYLKNVTTGSYNGQENTSGKVIIPPEPGFASIGAGGNQIPLQTRTSPAYDAQGNQVGVVGAAPYLPGNTPIEVVNPLNTQGDRADEVPSSNLSNDVANQDNQQILDMMANYNKGHIGKINNQVASEDNPYNLGNDTVTVTLEAPANVSPSSYGWDETYWRSINPELANQRMLGMMGGTQGDSVTSPTAPSLTYPSASGMTPTAKQALATELQRKGLLGANFGDADIDTALKNRLDALQSAVGPAPVLGGKITKTMKVGEAPTISVTQDFDSYYTKMNEWLAKQNAIVPQVQKEVGDSVASIYQQQIDNQKFQLELQKFNNDIKTGNATREGMNQLAAATSKAVKPEGQKNLDPTTFDSIKDLESFAERATAYSKLGEIPGTPLGNVAWAKNFTQAEGLGEAEGTRNLITLLATKDPKVRMLISNAGGIGAKENITGTLLASAIQMFDIDNPGAAKDLKKEMKFTKDWQTHSGTGKLPTLSGDTTETPDLGIARYDEKGIKTSGANNPEPPPTPEPAAVTPTVPPEVTPTKWYNQPFSDWFKSLNNNQFKVDSRTGAGIAKVVVDQNGQRYNVIDNGGANAIFQPIQSTPSKSVPAKASGKVNKKGPTKRDPLGLGI